MMSSERSVQGAVTGWPAILPTGINASSSPATTFGCPSTKPRGLWVQSMGTFMQGGDIDGVRGTFEAAHEKKLDIMSLGAAILGTGSATGFEPRHFVGKTIFAMSFLEKVFVYMSRAETGRVTLSMGTMDEVFMAVALQPLLVMNLRARFGPEDP